MSTISSRWSTGRQSRRSTRSSPSIVDAYDVADELRPGGERAGSLRDAARIEAGLRRFLDDGGFGAFTTNFEDLGGLRQLPGLAVQRLMADGYGFGGEGDWKTAALVCTLKAMGGGLPGGTSFMEDYTYHFGPGRPKILGAHMLEVCPSIARRCRACEIHPLSIGGREDPVRLVFTAAPGPASWSVSPISAIGSASCSTRSISSSQTSRCQICQWPAPCGRPRPDLATAARVVAHGGGPHHTVLSTAVDVDA